MMRLFKLLSVILASIILSGCILMMAFSGPRGMERSGGGYHVHSWEWVRLFKVKSPNPDWDTMRTTILKRNGKNEPLIFMDSSSNKNKNPRLYLYYYFDYGYNRDLYKYSMNFLSGNESDLINHHVSYSEKNGGNYQAAGVIYLNGMKCLKGRDKDKLGINRGTRYVVSIRCPGFFRKTYGTIMVSLTVDDVNNRFDMSLEDAYKEAEEKINYSISTFKLIEPFSQKIPKGYSIDEQISRIDKGRREYGPPKFKL